MDMKKVDYLIVGQGIAGSLFSHELLKREKSFHVVDHRDPQSSSRVAAGLYNPIIYKTLKKSWLADQLIPKAHQTYEQIERLTGARFDHKTSILKVFGGNNERDLWNERAAKSAYADFMAPAQEKNIAEEVHTPFGYGEIKKAGFVDTVAFLDGYRAFLDKEQLLSNELFDFNQLERSAASVKYKDIEAQQVVFCEGDAVRQNPFFDWLPMNPAKGEVLTMKIKKLSINHVLNKRVFLIPLGGENFRVGSNYAWDLNTIPTEEAKEEILDYLGVFYKGDYQITDHEAGIRPTVRDRRPILGRHPEWENLVVFNGLGTKGIMLGPYFAEQLVDFLETGTKIDVEVDVKRFEKEFSKKN